MQFLSIFLKLQAVKQIGPGFLAYPVFFQLLSDQRGELTYNLRKRALAINAKIHSKQAQDRQRTDREPGLVAFHYIRPGDQSDLFFEPRIPHGTEAGEPYRCLPN